MLSSNAMLALGGIIAIVIGFNGFPISAVIIFIIGAYLDYKYKIGHYEMFGQIEQKGGYDE